MPREACLRVRIVAAIAVLSFGIQTSAFAQQHKSRADAIMAAAKSDGPTDVLGWDWDYYVSGERLFYRGVAGGNEAFRSMQLSAPASKIAASSKLVYVWLRDGAD